MKPQAVVEARHNHPAGDEVEAVRQHARAEQLVIGNVGEKILMQCRVVGERVDGSYPAVLYRWQVHRLREADAFDRTELERPLRGQEAPHLHRYFLQHLGRHVEQVPESVRARHVGHVDLVLETVLGILE